MLSPQLQLFVAADEWNEAAFGLVRHCFAAERSLVSLVSCYEQLQLRGEHARARKHTTDQSPLPTGEG